MRLRAPESHNSLPAATAREGMARREFVAMSAILGTQGALMLLLGGKQEHGKGHGDHGHEAKNFGLREVYEHLEASPTVWHPAQQVLDQEEESCIDGRCGKCVACTPGGDMGDLGLKIAATEQVRGVRFSQKDVGEMFHRNLRHHRGPFYMHTDEKADQKIAARLGIKDMNEFKALMLNPGNRRDELMHVLLQADYMGCGHLKLMLKDKDGKSYPGMRPELLWGLMREYFSMQWADSSRTDRVVLEGDHQEGAVVKVVVDDPAMGMKTPFPLIAPKAQTKNGKSSVFVVHTQLEALSAQHWAEHVGDVARVSVDARQVVETIADLRGKYLMASALALAPGKDVYVARYSASRQKLIRVDKETTVPAGSGAAH